MRLLVDAGNTRVKWRLERSGSTVNSGADRLEEIETVPQLAEHGDAVGSIAVSTVISEENRARLVESLSRVTAAPVRFYWAESERSGLRNAYADYRLMGADRWHAMYAAWRMVRNGVAVIDAGSAVTIDYVSSNGTHLGGFILPGLNMMLRSLKSDAARIGFDPDDVRLVAPGTSTGECVNHGLAWLSSAMNDRVADDAKKHALAEVLVTGGDAGRLLDLGLVARHVPDLVLDGVGLIDAEESSA
ncbi:MAG: type III pantothenate kinase [Gammaproteobacteria bacterium]|nr:MAG: type III pantothenate kinase [Gammaproteobacteria bacterium]